MTHHLSRRARRGSALGITMILCALASVLAVTTLALGTHNRQMTLRARVQSDAARTATSAIHYTASQLKTKAESPTPSAISALATQMDIPLASLGVDADTYDLAASFARAVRVGDPVRLNRSQFKMSSYERPEFIGDPDGKGSSVDQLWAQPIRVQVSLTPKGVMTRPVTCTMEAALQFRVKSLFQVAMFFNDTIAWLPGGANTYRGGIHSNSPMYIWAKTTNASQGVGARIQIESISAPSIYFRNFGPSDLDTSGNPLPNSPSAWGTAGTYSQAVYISRGDLNGDKIISAYNPVGSKSSQTVSQNSFNPWTDEYRPAYPTYWDQGRTDIYNNYWTLDVGDTDPKTGKVTRAKPNSRIDSDNPNIGNLATLFKDNYKDSKTGFQKVEVSSLATTTPRSIIEPPNPSFSAAGASDQQVAAEAEKFSNKAGVYLYVETEKRFPGDTVPRVLAFKPGVNAAGKSLTAAQAVAQYKATPIAGPAAITAAKMNLADTLIELPAGIVETSRRFVDYTQQKQNASDTPTPRVSAVDIDMGKLREALGSKDAPAPTDTSKSIRTQTVGKDAAGNIALVDNGAWNATAGWNGVMYMEVDKPQGAGWSADTPPAAAQKQDTDSNGKLIFNSDGTPKMVAAETAIAAAPLKDNKGYDTANLTGVRIHNAEKLPDLAGTPGYKQEKEGFTFATNTAVYTVGNINADGNPDTDSSYGTSSGQDFGTYDKNSSHFENNSALNPTSGTQADKHQFPFAIAADAITVMSQKHKNPTGSATFGDNLTEGDNVANKTNASSNLYYRESFTELNFGAIAGGANPSANYQSRRPLQVYMPARWDANDIRYRGSLVTLFESQYSKKWTGGNGSQQSRAMDIGYARSYAMGYIPPGVPISMTSVLVNCAVIADSDFKSDTTFPSATRKAPSGIVAE